MTHETKPALASWPASSLLLASFGVALLLTGLYFFLLRPTLLPEDLRYIGLTPAQLAAMPKLAMWLNRVFSVLGGYVFACGVLTIALAATSFRAHQLTAWIGAFVGGLASIGWMVIVNFAIDSDFKWLLLLVAFLWIVSIVLFWTERQRLQAS